MNMTHSGRVSAFTLGVAVAAFAATSGAPAFAQDDQRVEYFKLLQDCQGETADEKRLACFDNAVAQMVQASNTGDLQIVDRAEVRETRRKFFGLALPDLGIFKKRDDNDVEELEVLQSAVANASRTRDGWLIETTEGAVWRIDNVPSRLLDPKAGQTLEFRKATLGSYFVRINEQLGVKGKRIR